MTWSSSLPTQTKVDYWPTAILAASVVIALLPFIGVASKILLLVSLVCCYQDLKDHRIDKLVPIVGTVLMSLGYRSAYQFETLIALAVISLLVVNFFSADIFYILFVLSYFIYRGVSSADILTLLIVFIGSIFLVHSMFKKDEIPMMPTMIVATAATLIGV